MVYQKLIVKRRPPTAGLNGNIMTNVERLKQKNRLMEQLAIVLESIMKGKQPSDKSTNCGIDHDLFEDTCNHAELYHSIFELKETLKTMVKYNNLVIEREERKNLK